MIDIKTERDAYKEGIINDVLWNRIEYNLADAVTKYSILPQIVELLQTGTVKYEVEQSVLRTLGPRSEENPRKMDKWLEKKKSTNVRTDVFGKLESQVWVARIELTVSTEAYLRLSFDLWFDLWFDLHV